ncbi:MAG: amino acid ABC transporter permease [Oscillospiraceae bacterium]|nr:amino acid ABC transporter permease [Oscillospiraceae bacterium]
MIDLLQKIYEALIINSSYKLIFIGLSNTLIITFLATLIGVFIGLIIAIIKIYSDKNKICYLASKFFNIYLAVIRGTPILIQLLIMYNIIFVFATSKQATLFVAVVAFGINSSAYVAEIIRSGITSIDPGQREAGLALGLGEFKTMLLIIIPQAIKNILPALFNEFIQLVKETSVAGYIGVEDLTRVSDIIKSQTYEPVGPLVIIATIYFLIVIILTSLLRYLERRR